MTRKGTENPTISHKEKIKRDREEYEAKIALEKDKQQAGPLTAQPMELKPSERSVELEQEEKKRAIQIYEDWLKKYKKQNPNFKEDENSFKFDNNGNGCLCFSDNQAEEDFVRYLAANSPRGSVIDKGILIARFEDSKLIDPRTNEEFPEGGYANLVQQLDSGIAYSDIPLPKTTAPNPFNIMPTPFN